jgi:hypothetical protein
VTDITALTSALTRDGFVHASAPDMRSMLEARGLAGWDDFAESWNDLGVDTYMADGGRYRRRRYAAFSVGATGARRKPHQPHYQSRDYNALNGGIARWFEPIKRDIGDHRAMQAILGACHDVFVRCTPVETRPDSWHVEVHQFRIETGVEVDGKPTPEGLHRDGVDWVLVLLVRRQNVASGETSIHDLRQRHLGSFILADPLEAAWVDDNLVYHGVTPVTPIDPLAPAYRDVLVVTFRRE